MSKGCSGYFSGTSGEGKALIDEVKANGYKINSNDVIGIAKDKQGKIVWLEQGHLGNNPSGLKHILDAHESNFNSKGIATSNISDFILTAVSKGDIIGYQGKGTGRPIYEVKYHGQKYKVAITVGSNGYIVGANPRS
jgi:filamentous hemagglutinin